MRFDYLFRLFTRHNFLYTRSVTRGNRTPGSRDATGCNSLGGHSLCGNETLKVEESARAMAAEGKTKHSQLHYQDEFQQQNCTVGSLHDSDHENLVRTFVGPSCGLGGFLFVYICIISEGQPHSW